MSVTMKEVSSLYSRHCAVNEMVDHVWHGTVSNRQIFILQYPPCIYLEILDPVGIFKRRLVLRENYRNKLIRRQKNRRYV